MAAPGGVEVGRVSVRVLPDTSRLGGDLKVALNRVEAGADLNIRAGIDTAGLDAQAKAAVEEARRAAGDIKIKAKVDRSQVSQFGTSLGGVADRADNLVGRIGLIGAAALTLGPTLIPIIATLGALGAALVAPLAIAGGGLTLFGVLTGAVIKQTEDQKKKIDSLKKSVDAARLSLSNTQASAAASAAASLATARSSADQSLKSARSALATAKTASARTSAQTRINAAQATLASRQASIQGSQSRSVAAAQRKVNQAMAAYHTALAGLTPAQKKFLSAQDHLKGAFQGLITTVGPALLGPVTQVINLLATLAPTLKPILKAVSDVLGGIISQFHGVAKDPGYKKFVDSFAKQLGPDIKAFADIAGNVFQGLFGLFGVFNRTMSGSVLKSLETLTGKFADFGKKAGESKGLKSFVDFVKRVTPGVIDALKKVGKALGRVIEALAPLGPPVLRIVSGIADQFSKIPVPVLTKFAAAMASIVLVQKLGGFKALSLLSRGIGSIGGGGGIKGTLGGLVNGRVVKVFVTNPGFSKGGIAGAGGKGGVLGKAESVATGILAGSGLSAAAATAWATTGAVVGFAAVKGYQASHTNALLDGPFGFNTLVDKIGTGAFHIGPKKDDGGMFDVKAAIAALSPVGSHADALRQSLQRASQQIDKVGPKADLAFGAASRDVHRFAGELDAIKDKKLRILLDDLDAVRALEDLQRFRIKDKSFKVTENVIDRAVGPGGGIGLPSNNDGTAVPRNVRPTSRASGDASTSRGGDTYNIQAHDYNDFLRQLQRRKRGRAGGGVRVP